MKSCYLDANTLFYFQDPKSPFNKEAKVLVNQLIKQKLKILTSSLALDEYIHSVIRFSGKSRLEMKIPIRRSLKKIFKLPNLELINPPLELKKHLKVIILMVKYNLKPRDAYHLFMMLENKIGYFATFDNDFKEVFKSGKMKKFI